MQVHKIVLFVVDHDRIGAEACCGELMNANYGNDCIYPQVVSSDTRDIGEWSDDNPLNNSKTADAELRRLFDTSHTGA